MVVAQHTEIFCAYEQYNENKPFQEKYKKSKDPDRYFQMHETQLILYDGAERMLEKMELIPQTINAIEVKNDYKTMESKKVMLEEKYKASKNNINALQQKLSNVEQFISPNQLQLKKRTTKTHL